MAHVNHSIERLAAKHCQKLAIAYFRRLPCLLSICSLPLEALISILTMYEFTSNIEMHVGAGKQFIALQRSDLSPLHI